MQQEFGTLKEARHSSQVAIETFGFLLFLLQLLQPRPTTNSYQNMQHRIKTCNLVVKSFRHKVQLAGKMVQTSFLVGCYRIKVKQQIMINKKTQLPFVHWVSVKLATAIFMTFNYSNLLHMQFRAEKKHHSMPF